MSCVGVTATVPHRFWPLAGCTGMVITPSMPLATRPAAAGGGTKWYDKV